MMRAFMRVVAVPLLAVSVAGFSAPLSKKTEKTNTKQLTQLIGQLEDLAQQANACREIYQTDIEINKSRFRTNTVKAEIDALQQGRSRLTALERASVQEASLEDFKREAKFPSCQEEARQRLQKAYPPLMKSWAKPVQLAAKAPIAKWLTLIDAVPSDKYEDELSNFRAAINDLKVESMQISE